MSRPRSKAADALPPEATPGGQGAAATTDKPRKRHAHAKGSGTLTLRGNIYQARWVVNGKIYVRSTKTGIKRDAEKKLQEFTAEFKAKDEKRIVENLSARVQGVTAEIARFEDGKPALAIRDTWDAYVAAQNRPDSGARTLNDYSLQFDKLEAWLAERHPDATELRHVSQQIADEFAAWIGATLSPNTFNKYITLFRCMWSVLAETARLPVNPWTSIRKKIQIGHTRRELTVEELTRVCGSLTGEMRMLFAIGIYTGLRLGDCALLSWGSVDMARRIVSVVPRKVARHTSGKTVVIPIHAALAAMLAEVPAAGRRGYVLPGIAGQYQQNPSALSKQIRQVFEDAGIVTRSAKENGARDRVEVGFHSLRHTFVSLASNAGVPLAVVQSIVGHTNPAMTLHYFHSSDTALKSAVAALPDIASTQQQPKAWTADADPLLRTFREIVDRMNAAQLAEARRYIGTEGR